MELVEKDSLKADAPEFEIGDTVDVHCKILEGHKSRTQVFSGTVIGRSGSGAREMFTVRRIVAGQGVERKFPVHSPRIEKIEVKRSSYVKRAKLYYLRDRRLRWSGGFFVGGTKTNSCPTRPKILFNHNRSSWRLLAGYSYSRAGIWAYHLPEICLLV